MTAPDPGLTDLIAAHVLSGPYIEYDSDGHHADDFYRCGENCKWTSNEGTVNRSAFATHAAHVALVVEQHTNGRIAPVLEDFDWHIQNASNGAVFAAEADDGQGLISWQNEMGIYQRAARLLRAALEGEQR